MKFLEKFGNGDPIDVRGGCLEGGQPIAQWTVRCTSPQCPCRRRGSCNSIDRGITKVVAVENEQSFAGTRPCCPPRSSEKSTDDAVEGDETSSHTKANVSLSWHRGTIGGQQTPVDTSLPPAVSNAGAVGAVLAAVVVVCSVHTPPHDEWRPAQVAAAAVPLLLLVAVYAPPEAVLCRAWASVLVAFPLVQCTSDLCMSPVDLASIVSAVAESWSLTIAIRLPFFSCGVAHYGMPRPPWWRGALLLHTCVASTLGARAVSQLQLHDAAALTSRDLAKIALPFDEPLANHYFVNFVLPFALGFLLASLLLPWRRFSRRVATGGVASDACSAKRGGRWRSLRARGHRICGLREPPPPSPPSSPPSSPPPHFHPPLPHPANSHPAADEEQGRGGEAAEAAEAVREAREAAEAEEAGEAAEAAGEAAREVAAADEVVGALSQILQSVRMRVGGCVGGVSEAAARSADLNTPSTPHAQYGAATPRPPPPPRASVIAPTSAASALRLCGELEAYLRQSTATSGNLQQSTAIYSNIGELEADLRPAASSNNFAGASDAGAPSAVTASDAGAPPAIAAGAAGAPGGAYSQSGAGVTGAVTGAASAAGNVGSVGRLSGSVTAGRGGRLSSDGPSPPRLPSSHRSAVSTGGSVASLAGSKEAGAPTLTTTLLNAQHGAVTADEKANHDVGSGLTSFPHSRTPWAAPASHSALAAPPHAPMPSAPPATPTPSAAEGAPERGAVLHLTKGGNRLSARHRQRQRRLMQDAAIQEAAMQHAGAPVGAHNGVRDGAHHGVASSAATLAAAFVRPPAAACYPPAGLCAPGLGMHQPGPGMHQLAVSHSRCGEPPPPSSRWQEPLAVWNPAARVAVEHPRPAAQRQVPPRPAAWQPPPPPPPPRVQPASAYPRSRLQGLLRRWMRRRRWERMQRVWTAWMIRDGASRDGASSTLDGPS